MREEPLSRFLSLFPVYSSRQKKGKLTKERSSPPPPRTGLRSTRSFLADAHSERCCRRGSIGTTTTSTGGGRPGSESATGGVGLGRCEGVRYSLFRPASPASLDSRLVIVLVLFRGRPGRARSPVVRKAGRIEGRSSCFASFIQVHRDGLPGRSSRRRAAASQLPRFEQARSRRRRRHPAVMRVKDGERRRRKEPHTPRALGAMHFGFLPSKVVSHPSQHGRDEVCATTMESDNPSGITKKEKGTEEFMTEQKGPTKEGWKRTSSRGGERFWGAI